jgi:hypothetical protein
LKNHVFRLDWTAPDASIGGFGDSWAHRRAAFDTSPNMLRPIIAEAVRSAPESAPITPHIPTSCPVRKIIEHVSGRLPGEPQKWRAESDSEDAAKESRQGFFDEVEGDAPHALLNSLEVAIDRLLAARERSNELVTQMVPAADIVEAESVDVHSVVHVRHGVPRQAAFGQVLEQRVRRRAGLVDLADIVHAHAPLEAGTMEHMGEAAGGNAGDDVGLCVDGPLL